MGFFSKIFKKVKNVVVKVAKVAAPVLAIAAPVLAPISATLATAASVGAKIAGGINTVGTVTGLLKGDKSPAQAQAELAANDPTKTPVTPVTTTETPNTQVNTDQILAGVYPTNLVDLQAQLKAAVEANKGLATELQNEIQRDNSAAVNAETKAQAEITAAQERIAAYSAAKGGNMVYIYGAAGLGIIYLLTRKGK